MSYSIQRAVSDGTMTLLPVSIEYFDRDEISVLFNGVLNARQWAWVGTTDHTLSFTPAVTNGMEVSVVRTTDLAALRHYFSNGAAFTAESLDESLLQILHIAQEAKEGANLGEIFQNLNFHGFKAINMGDGSDPMDAVNHRQMEVHDATIVGYRDQAAASAAAAALSETNTVGALVTHVVATNPHTQYVRTSEVGTVVQPYSANIATVAASKDEMEAGLESAARVMSPLRVAQAIAALGGGSGKHTGVPTKLVVRTTGLNANITVTFDEAVLRSASNLYQTVYAGNLTLNSAASGANGLDTGTVEGNTWYYVWVIWNGSTTAALLSLSSTAPTMPGGYTHKARVGAVRTDGTANKYPFPIIQYGRRVQYAIATGSNLVVMPQIAIGVLGTYPSTYSAFSVSTFVPPTSAGIVVTAGCVSALVYGIAPNNSYGSPGGLTNPPPMFGNGPNSIHGMLLLESTNIYAVSSSTVLIACLGWEDNL